MKATELMIGDWIMADGVPAQILSLGSKGATITGGLDKACYYDNMQPIPLTPEILEKNGFVYADLPFEDFYEGYGLHIHGGNYADGHSNWYIICGINVSMNVTHVHELQQALRLCGIDKEIVL